MSGSHARSPAAGGRQSSTLTEPCEGRKRQGMPSLTSALNVTVSSRAAAAASVAASGLSLRARILSSTVCRSRHSEVTAVGYAGLQHACNKFMADAAVRSELRCPCLMVSHAES